MASKTKETVEVVVKEEFFDLQENVMRSVGEKIEVTAERLEQIKQFINDEKSKA